MAAIATAAAPRTIRPAHTRFTAPSPSHRIGSHRESVAGTPADRSSGGRPRGDHPAGVRRCHAAIRIVGTGVFKSGRVEFMAIPLMVVILGVLFLVFAVSAVGVWAWIVTGVVILAAIILLAWRGVQRHQHQPAADAPRPAEHRAPGAYRILVVVDESCAPAAIRDAVAARAAGHAAESFVVAPAAGSRLDRLMGDEAGYSKAQSHLDETLAELAAVHGLDSKGGKIGSHDPIQAADESLR